MRAGESDAVGRGRSAAVGAPRSAGMDDGRDERRHAGEQPLRAGGAGRGGDEGDIVDDRDAWTTLSTRTRPRRRWTPASVTTPWSNEHDPDVTEPRTAPPSVRPWDWPEPDPPASPRGARPRSNRAARGRTMIAPEGGAAAAAATAEDGARRHAARAKGRHILRWAASRGTSGCDGSSRDGRQPCRGADLWIRDTRSSDARLRRGKRRRGKRRRRAGRRRGWHGAPHHKAPPNAPPGQLPSGGRASPLDLVRARRARATQIDPNPNPDPKRRAVSTARTVATAVSSAAPPRSLRARMGASAAAERIRTARRSQRGSTARNDGRSTRRSGASQG